MSTAHEDVRHGLLVDALRGPADLTVYWHVRQHNPSASPPEVQSETLEVIRSLMSDGLFTLGAMLAQREHYPQRFVPWRRALDHSFHTITHLYVKHYSDPGRCMYSVWLQLTDKGERLARSIEATDLEGYRPRK